MEIITSSKFSLKTIVQRHRSDFLTRYWNQCPDRKIRMIVFLTISKILACNTWGLGFATYRCDQCWAICKQSFTCKSRFCVTCSKPASDKRYHNFISWRPQHLHTYHLFFTIPEELRRFFCCNREREDIALRLLSQSANQVLIEFFIERYKCKTGGVSVIHTFGADLKRNPHIHFLIVAGGFSLYNSVYGTPQRISVKDQYLPYDKLNAMWKYRLLTNCREYGKKEFSPDVYKEFNKLIEFLFEQKNWQWEEKSWFVWVDKKIVSFRVVLKYIWRYLKRPVIGESRIEAYDGEFITFWYKDRKTKEEKHITLPIHEFLLLLCRHIPDKHFKMISYFWIFANRCKEKYLAMIQRHYHYRPNTYYIPRRFGERCLFYFDRDPLTCSCWGHFHLFSLTTISRFWSKKTVLFNTS